MNSASSEPAGVPIAAVERDTGLSKDTLRIWERRYGFPQPLRGPVGERAYPADQVLRLRLIKRLLDAGHRPGRLMALDEAALQALAQAEAAPREGQAASATGLGRFGEPLETHDGPALRRMLQQDLLAGGLEAFVTQRIADLNVAVGEAWQAGRLTVAQEHVYTECVHLVLRQALGRLPDPAADAPRVLLATLPQEPHGLGLLMAEAMLSLHGCRCVSLGTQVPLGDIVTAARSTKAGIVGLSFTGSFRPQLAAAALGELRSRLPATVALWAGGSSLALKRRLPQGVDAVHAVADIPRLLAGRGHPSDTGAP
ncbi:MerR family transcriptional regulator [Caenimonas sedimenti]|uniref:MerR family transcriptional regulator n=1 Tax=Caenimonas sedimenti TaxID=2596921 RepID=UPI002107C486|nr:cobalamin B12-binding domain-containing protein [Caenimonas sedimenti]